MQGDSKVIIMMSAYNGQEYIAEQIHSIMSQEGCDVRLMVRDDGSTDQTVAILRQLQERYPHRISVATGQNIGYRKSFLRILKKAPAADYYGFADQDDVWMSDKCQKAIEKIKREGTADCILYASSVVLTDEHGNPFGENDITTSPNNVGSYFARHRMPGCGMLFTRALKEKAVSFLETAKFQALTDHDLVIGAIAYAYGQVIRDDMAYIYHRRSAASVTGGGKGLLDRIKRECFVVFGRRDVHYVLAKELLDFDKSTMNDDARALLEMIAEYKSSAKMFLRLLKESGLATGMKVCDLETKIKIALRNF